jgi:hypothetical protein
MFRWSIAAIFAALVFGACADDDLATGELSPSHDGGPVGDADAESPDAGVGSTTCGVVKSGGGTRDVSCNRFQIYTCGADIYAIDCHCPRATCTCHKNRVLVAEVSNEACPSCEVAFESAAERCGFPAPGDVVAPPRDD